MSFILCLSVSIPSHWIASDRRSIVPGSTVREASVRIIIVSIAVVVVSAIGIVSVLVTIIPVIRIGITISISISTIKSVAIAHIAYAYSGSVAAYLNLNSSELGLRRAARENNGRDERRRNGQSLNHNKFLCVVKKRKKPTEWNATVFHFVGPLCTALPNTHLAALHQVFRNRSIVTSSTYWN